MLVVANVVLDVWDFFQFGFLKIPLLEQVELQFLQ